MNMNKINFLLLCIILLYGCSDDNMYNTRFFCRESKNGDY